MPPTKVSHDHPWKTSAALLRSSSMSSNWSSPCSSLQSVAATDEHTCTPVYYTPPPGSSSFSTQQGSTFPNAVALDDHDQLPTTAQFDCIVREYLHNLSTKKRDKALVDQCRYELILKVLKDPRNTSISTAQFRFWVKKMFQLMTVNRREIVCHDSKPVAMREQIYDILVHAHREALHGGRDKTSALVRRQYSWIPKELIARFVRHCPYCISRRNGCQSPSFLPMTFEEERQQQQQQQQQQQHQQPMYHLQQQKYSFDHFAATAAAVATTAAAVNTAKTAMAGMVPAYDDYGVRSSGRASLPPWCAEPLSLPTTDYSHPPFYASATSFFDAAAEGEGHPLSSPFASCYPRLTTTSPLPPAWMSDVSSAPLNVHQQHHLQQQERMEQQPSDTTQYYIKNDDIPYAHATSSTFLGDFGQDMKAESVAAAAAAAAVARHFDVQALSQRPTAIKSEDHQQQPLFIDTANVSLPAQSTPSPSNSLSPLTLFSASAADDDDELVPLPLAMQANKPSAEGIFIDPFDF